MRKYYRVIRIVIYLPILVCLMTFTVSGLKQIPSIKNGAVMYIFSPEVNAAQGSQAQHWKNHMIPKIYNFTMNDIENKPRALADFKGKVMMIVNTASFCGNTPQYAGLQTLYERYHDQGFTVLAFPANDFGQQEPGDNQDIAEFCYTKYALQFPLFSKITVLGEEKHPLYRYLTEETNFRGEIEWNFQKFLISREGAVVARYAPGLKPLSPQIIADIEEALRIS